MILKIKRYIRQYPLLMNIAKKIYRKVKILIDMPVNKKLAEENMKNIEKYASTDKKRIFYFCVPVHANLGDQAQAYCIRNWIKKNYEDRIIIEINSKPAAVNMNNIFGEIQKIIKKEDFIVVQSGYCTTDMHGVDEKVHRMIVNTFKDNVVVVFPQTIKFIREEEKRLTAEAYNSHKHVIFMARDKISYDTAKEMFNDDVKLLLYPDIVTSLIGRRKYNNHRDAVLFCMRNDGETFYKNSDVSMLMKKIEEKTKLKTKLTDTTINLKMNEIKNRIEDYIFNDINEFSKYRLIITDRYHGTIFSLIAGTPVIVLKTNDHKVSSGVDWFKDIYPQYIRFSKSLEEVLPLAEEILKLNINNELDDYFEKKYYDSLKTIVNEELEKC